MQKNIYATTEFNFIFPFRKATVQQTRPLRVAAQMRNAESWFERKKKHRTKKNMGLNLVHNGRERCVSFSRSGQYWPKFREASSNGRPVFIRSVSRFASYYEEGRKKKKKMCWFSCETMFTQWLVGKVSECTQRQVCPVCFSILVLIFRRISALLTIGKEMSVTCSQVTYSPRPCHSRPVAQPPTIHSLIDPFTHNIHTFGHRPTQSASRA